METLISQILQVVIILGGPLVPLLILAIEIGRWHDRHDDPVELQTGQED